MKLNEISTELKQKFNCEGTEESQGTITFCETFLLKSDAKVLQRIREQYLNIDLTMSEAEYLELEQARQACVEYIREHEDEC